MSMKNVEPKLCSPAMLLNHEAFAVPFYNPDNTKTDWTYSMPVLCDNTMPVACFSQNKTQDKNTINPFCLFNGVHIQGQMLMCDVFGLP